MIRKLFVPGGTLFRGLFFLSSPVVNENRWNENRIKFSGTPDLHAFDRR